MFRVACSVFTCVRVYLSTYLALRVGVNGSCQRQHIHTRRAVLEKQSRDFIERRARVE